MKYEPIIGLEVHAEMMTASKMFCGCRVVDSVEAEPNRAVCPVCLAMPGMLPVINKRAVEMAAKVALALNCTIQPYNFFARKNYFYPDLPKGYQITQFEDPIGVHGWLDIQLPSGAEKRIRIRRVHMEEDTGKLTHLEGGGSLVDYNRAGVPLLEIVSEPDIETAEEAVAYATSLRQILRYLEVNSGDMEKGVIRFEANTSIRPIGSDQFGTRTEVKNLNSFRSLGGAIEYEIERQTKLIDAGGVVDQETLGWHENKRVTYTQRSKEDAHDYRYFREPDLPPLYLEERWIEWVRGTLPELPAEKRIRYQERLGLSAYQAEVLSEDKEVGAWFETAVAAGGAAELVANWMINELFRLLNEEKISLAQMMLTPEQFVAVLRLVTTEKISQNSGKQLLGEIFMSDEAAEKAVARLGLAQISDEGAIADLVAQIIAEHPTELADYRAGKVQLRGWFMGRIMKASKGKASPALVNQLLDELLNKE